MTFAVYSVEVEIQGETTVLNTVCKLALPFRRFLGFQGSAGLEPAKFRPQSLLCATNQSQPVVHKMGGLSGNSCFHFVLLCLA